MARFSLYLSPTFGRTRDGLADVDIGSPQQITPPPARRRRRWHRRHPWLLLLLILATCVFVVEVGLTPWDLHIGRRVTSTADAGTAAVTLRYGSSAAFARACRTLATQA